MHVIKEITGPIFALPISVQLFSRANNHTRLHNHTLSHAPSIPPAPIYCHQNRHLAYRALTRFHPPLTRFHPPIISSISKEFALSERYVLFWCTNLQLTAGSSHYLMWLKSLCSWMKARQRWMKARQSTVGEGFLI